jgi:hypothetical protein
MLDRFDLEQVEKSLRFAERINREPDATADGCGWRVPLRTNVAPVARVAISTGHTEATQA